MATGELLSFLQQNNLIDIEITPKKAEEVIAEICRLIIIYGQQELGFDTKPITLGPALRRFNMVCESPSHHNRNKIIHLKQRN